MSSSSTLEIRIVSSIPFINHRKLLYDCNIRVTNKHSFYSWAVNLPCFSRERYRQTSRNHVYDVTQMLQMYGNFLFQQASSLTCTQWLNHLHQFFLFCRPTGLHFTIPRWSFRWPRQNWGRWFDSSLCCRLDVGWKANFHVAFSLIRRTFAPVDGQFYQTNFGALRSSLVCTEHPSCDSCLATAAWDRLGGARTQRMANPR